MPGSLYNASGQSQLFGDDVCGATRQDRQGDRAGGQPIDHLVDGAVAAGGDDQSKSPGADPAMPRPRRRRRVRLKRRCRPRPAAGLWMISAPPVMAAAGDRPDSAAKSRDDVSIDSLLKKVHDTLVTVQ